MNIFRFRSATLSAHPGESNEDRGPVSHEPLLEQPTEYDPVLNPPLDEEKEAKIKRLLDYMDSIILDEKDPYYPNERGFITKATVHRYMRARKWDFEAAKNMMENTVKWRRSFKPDQLDPNYIRAEEETGKMYYSGYDKNGRPLWIMKPRYENSKDSERQIKNVVFCLERGIRLMPPKVEKISIVVDFKGSTASNNAGVSTSKKFLDILGNHYPERLGIAFLVNSPWFFLTTFKLISPFMDPVTRNKIKFLNSEDTKQSNDSHIKLDDYIPASQIEVSLGGEYNFVFDINIYWNRLLEKTGNPFKLIEYN